VKLRGSKAPAGTANLSSQAARTSFFAQAQPALAESELVNLLQGKAPVSAYFKPLQVVFFQEPKNRRGMHMQMACNLKEGQDFLLEAHAG
jgi:hypothetical protein